MKIDIENAHLAQESVDLDLEKLCESIADARPVYRRGDELLGPATEAEAAAIDAALAELDVAEADPPKTEPVADKTATQVEPSDKIATPEPSDKTATDRKSDKSATRGRRKSILADGNLVRELKGICYFDRIDANSFSVVYASPSTLPLSPVAASASPSPLCSSVRPPVSLPESVKPTKEKPWRDVGEVPQGLLFHVAMTRLPDIRGFTLRLSEQVEKDARSQGKQCLAYLHQRMERFLRRALKSLGAECSYWWFKMEEAPEDGSLHLHGEIQVNTDLEAPFRTALQGVGGDWEGHGRGSAQLRLSKDTPDFGWAGYTLKDWHKVGPARRQMMQRFGKETDRRWVAQFQGKSLTASIAVRRAAQVEYELALKVLAAQDDSGSVSESFRAKIDSRGIGKRFGLTGELPSENTSMFQALISCCALIFSSA